MRALRTTMDVAGYVPRVETQRPLKTLLLSRVTVLLLRRRRRAQIALLQGLDDHVLRDIGLTRSEITDYVDGRVGLDRSR